MNELEIIRMVKAFPIGEQAKTRIELLSKIEMVSYLSRFQEQFSICLYTHLTLPTNREV